jgi:hypothetical protein
MGAKGAGRSPPPIARLLTLREIPAPSVRRSVIGNRRLVFARYALPHHFDVRDHAARVREFDRAFVAPVTADVESYRTAARYVVRRFGKRDEVVPSLPFGVVNRTSKKLGAES